MGISAKEAADRVGMTKAGIIKAIKTGKISAAKTENGEWLIEPVELFRVYAPVNQNTVDVTPEVDSGTPNKISGLQAEIEHLRELLRRSDARADDLGRRLDQEGEERRALTRMLTDQRVESSRKSIWARLTGK